MTSKKLKNYIEGQGCKCYAHNSSECGCNVDWTPKEVYELREDLEFRRQLYKVQAAQLDKIRSERDEAREALMKIEDLFVDGTDVYADREKMGMIAREALEGAK